MSRRKEERPAVLHSLMDLSAYPGVILKNILKKKFGLFPVPNSGSWETDNVCEEALPGSTEVLPRELSSLPANPISHWELESSVHFPYTVLSWVSRESTLSERRWHHFPAGFGGTESCFIFGSTLLCISPLSLSLAGSGRPSLTDATIPSPMLTCCLLAAGQGRNKSINSSGREVKWGTILLSPKGRLQITLVSGAAASLFLSGFSMWQWKKAGVEHLNSSLPYSFVITFQHLEQRLPSGASLAVFSM